MKRIFLNIFLLAGLIITASCSNEDNDDNSSAAMKGTWKLTAWNVDGSYDLNNDGTASPNLLDEMDCYNNERIVFTDDTATYMTTSYADIYAEFVDGTGYTFTVECEEEVDSSPATYTRNGNALTITTTYEEDGETETDIILATVNGNTLTFVEEEGFVIEEDNYDVVVEDLTLVFTKQ